ncbi:(Fe-S)-binding protein [uncultured Acetobacteroides sp.]|uniref:(Fe-S)-binding protein n=1 Tax=uncultured Acetobacteroides sp. TaxID=1760811 RepID=UPI0029F4969C|nr:(Fe-S)-binding protein [uncultured Acetobacteroides sp.]
MDKFNIFVLPFTIGLVFVVGAYIAQLIHWIRLIPKDERRKLKVLLASPVRFVKCCTEIAKESLLHINLFKTNLLLGFMHMSLAFGWFMLIVIGNLESKVFTASHLNPPYFPIFLEFFIPGMSKFKYHQEFSFIMDFFLLLVLTGVVLAFSKRFVSKKFSIAKKPKLTVIDKIGLYSLWLIFPLRFLAESINSGIHETGGFITQPMGELLYNAGFGKNSSYAAWWAYSISLGVFFIAVPFTRYMHILTEPFFIFLRNAEVDSSKFQQTFNQVQAKSCSKCGVCLNACPLTTTNISGNPQPIYLLNALNQGTLSPEMVENCLNCRRCEENCPVGITIEPLRISLKKQVEHNADFSYTSLAEYPKAKIGYFSGCMGKLTPATTSSLGKIAETAGDKLVHLDKDGGICCGRPQKLSGQLEAAEELAKKNTALFKESGVEMIVTSCPICLKTFKENYQLSIPVIHHTEYIKRLIENEKIGVNKSSEITVYHDPCELARGCGITKEPRYILKKASHFTELPKEIKGQCCGNTMAHNSLNYAQKDAIANITLCGIPSKASSLITSCPACSKAFKRSDSITVEDIAVFTARHMYKPEPVYEEQYYKTANKRTATT